MNTPSMVGRQCAKQTQKDKNLLAGLGVVTIAAPSNVHCKNKVDRLLSDTPGSRLMNDTAFFQPGNGKLTFRSHLSDSERAAVKKVASGKLGEKRISSCYTFFVNLNLQLVEAFYVILYYSLTFNIFRLRDVILCF